MKNKVPWSNCQDIKKTATNLFGRHEISGSPLHHVVVGGETQLVKSPPPEWWSHFVQVSFGMINHHHLARALGPYTKQDRGFNFYYPTTQYIKRNLRRNIHTSTMLFIIFLGGIWAWAGCCAFRLLLLGWILAVFVWWLVGLLLFFFGGWLGSSGGKKNRHRNVNFFQISPFWKRQIVFLPHILASASLVCQRTTFVTWFAGAGFVIWFLLWRFFLEGITFNLKRQQILRHSN